MAALDQAITWGFGNDSIHECPFLPWHVTAVPSVVPILIPSPPHQCLCVCKKMILVHNLTIISQYMYSEVSHFAFKKYLILINILLTDYPVTGLLFTDNIL